MDFAVEVLMGDPSADFPYRELAVFFAPNGVESPATWFYVGTVVEKRGVHLERSVRDFLAERQWDALADPRARVWFGLSDEVAA